MGDLHLGHVCWGFGMGMGLSRIEGPYSWSLIAAVVALGFFGMVLDYLAARARKEKTE